MKTKTYLLIKLCILSCFAISACAHKAAKTNYTPPTRAYEKAPGNADSSSYAGSTANTAPMVKSESRAPKKRHKTKSQNDFYPQERPGLGTSFGEQRTSYVQEAPFVRASQRPFASVSVFYNDYEGVNAQVNYRGGEDFHPVHAYTPHRGISVSLQDKRGNILPGMQAGGDTYVIGQDGERYSLVIQNLTGGRYEVVASVDGLDVVDGLAANYSKRGYLLEPYNTLVIDGFRTSDRSVAAFRFGSVRDSYAAKTSGDRNVGVLGIAFFAEYGSPWTTDELRRRQSADPFPGNRYAKPPRY